MKSYSAKFWQFLTVTLTILLLTACGGSGGSSSSTSTGTLQTSLTDNSTEDYKAIYVTIDRVDVHSESGGWQTVASPEGTYNLLSLVNGVREELGIKTLDTGHYTQLRLILGKTAEPNAANILEKLHPYANYLIDKSLIPNEIELTVPSGFNSGIKVVSGFDISENQTTELILDFDAMKSVVKAGSSGQYLLKPTIKVLETVDSAVVSGLVSDDANDSVLGEALVSAQIYNSDTDDDSTQVEMVRSTITTGDALEDSGGLYNYLLNLPEQLDNVHYNLVAYRTGYQPSCTAIKPKVGTLTTVDFPLTATTETGTITATVNGIDTTTNPYATIDFRQAGLCEVYPEEIINVKTLEIAANGIYNLVLPVGDYKVVATTYDEEDDGTISNQSTISTTFSVTPGDSNPLAIDF
ncbi:DUF4382 domain-containing protein [Malonomonas rubra]|uniref:DUF4382 domain-containing protein n=1 Tax=Malonomonas rubra TaxID=57040 RepID=UPI0026ECB36B|nr:DUF4382 domain-containing protein [Malonomonas rubra]